MSGHSKWANIKHKKGKSDAQKAKVFTKLGREIQIAVKSGGPDPETNSKLKDVIVKAKAANKWLEEGNTVKVTVRFRGRQMAHVELGEETFKNGYYDKLYLSHRGGSVTVMGGEI